ncbi:hypothetical protein UFOVP105_7 [uncultured Caudovirales phage]|uniref:Uncharacterized protein n=1 Tax=uncultured Caudovirales phage TaxID=2100421 RepID=A0A6J5L5R5_9CAUD|nr:hypothetical protein UFOVP105_7 [uncultured Caudovirales phage]
MDEKTILYIFGILGGIINYLLQRQVKQGEQVIKELKEKNTVYDSVIVKSNEKYIALKSSVEAIEHNIKNDRRNVTELFNLKFEQILKEYTDIKEDFKEIKKDLKELINSKNERNN